MQIAKLVRTESIVGITLAAALGILSVPAIAASARPPKNDNPESAQPIRRLPKTIRETTTNATLAGDEPQSTCGSMGQTVWFSYTPTETVSVEVNTLGSTEANGDYDTVLAVYTFDDISGYVQQACDDDSSVDPNNGHISQLFFTAEAGVTYYIQVGSYGSNTYTDSRLVLNVVPVVP